jgi:hypothetical protein
MPSNNPGIARIVFREILDGDRRKFIADSNDADTGGGARDLRFRAWDSLEPIFKKLFPQVRQLARRRDGLPINEMIYVGTFNWQDSAGTVRTKEALLETPTDARPNEARIAKVHEYGCFQSIPPYQGTGRLLVLFVQNPDDTVWPVFATEQSLNQPGWHPAVANFLLKALSTKRRTGNAAYGYVDFTANENFIR